MAVRAVLDTNVFISAHGFGGRPGDVVRAAVMGEFELVTSPAILAEVADKLYEVLDFDNEHVETVVRQLARVADVVRPTERLSVVADEPDNRVLECAVEGVADVIVSGDRHLLGLEAFRGVPIVRVAEFMDAWLERSG